MTINKTIRCLSIYMTNCEIVLIYHIPLSNYICIAISIILIHKNDNLL